VPIGRLRLIYQFVSAGRKLALLYGLVCSGLAVLRWIPAQDFVPVRRVSFSRLSGSRRIGRIIFETGGGQQAAC